MKNNKNKRNSKNIFDSSTIRSVFMWMLIFMGMVSIMYHLSNMHVKQLSYSKFYAIVEHNLDNEVIIDAKKTDNLITGTFSQQGKDIVGGGAAYFKVYIPPEDKDLIPILRNNVKEFLIEPPKVWLSFFSAIFPMLLFILFLWYFAYRGNKQMGGNLFSFGKSKARAIDGTKGLKTSFFDVAGVDEAKEELKEIIEFLRDPQKFQKLGGRIPKGVLLIGPPGCGKTLLARAVAGEAEVPFFSISGSDFVEMFVGVGASRVRDLFEQAKKASKVSNKGVIVFIDEIDAVGRQRFSGIGGGHDEREQTLNQLLVEMDGFETDVGVIVVAATNRPDVLDPALLRPGRFDRHVVVDSPDILGRESILKVHTKKIKLGNEVKLSIIAKQTPGFSGADLENLCNEAALLAARREKESVSNDELQEAMERIIAGPQRKSRVISKKEKEITAYHEGGHALLHIYLKHADPLHKVSIIPRGITALGYTMPLPIQDKNIHSRSELLDKLCIFFGGVVAEELIFNEMTTGSSNDLEQATKIARRMVTEFGMSDKIGKIVLTKNQGPVFLGRDLAEHQEYSENTAKLMDQEIKKILQDSYDRAKEILEPKIGQLKSLAARLLEKEVMTAEEVKEVIGLNGKKSNENNSPEDK